VVWGNQQIQVALDMDPVVRRPAATFPWTLSSVFVGVVQDFRSVFVCCSLRLPGKSWEVLLVNGI